MCVKQERYWMKQQKNEIKIAFFDIDGTLIDFDKESISEKTKTALNGLRKNGIRIVLATGRAPVTLPQFDGVEFDAFLTFNGSCCYNEKDTIFSKPIPHSDVEQIIKNATKMDRPVSVATKKRVAANGKDKDLQDYYTIVKLPLEIAVDFEQIIKDDVYQIMVGSRKEEYPYLIKEAPNAQITAWWERAVDIIPKDSGKGNGVDRILDYYHLTREQALAFGDGGNDIEMLQTVGTGVAMGNASEEVKLSANEVCKSVSEDGVYHYCLEHGLI